MTFYQLHPNRTQRNPTLPKCIENVHEVLSTQTSKDGDMCLVNDLDLNIITFSCHLLVNLYSNPPQYIEQFYTICGYSNGQYIPLVFALLASKSEDACSKFLQHVIDLCNSRNFTFKPSIVRI